MPLKKKNASVQKIVKKHVASSMPAKIKKSEDYFYAVGRRKTAAARIRLFMGSGDNTINDKSILSYLPGASSQKMVLSPFDVTGTAGAFRFSAKVVGGGVQAQAEAIAMGISRCLVKVDEAHKKALRDHGFLTRDPRMKETRKMGMGGKARRAKQSPKR